MKMWRFIGLIVSAFCLSCAISLIAQPESITPDNINELQKIALNLGHAPSTGDIAWVPQRDSLAIVSLSDILVHEVGSPTNEVRSQIHLDSPISAMTFSLDGSFVILGDADGGVYLIDTESWEVRHQIDGGEEPIKDVAVSPGGLLIAAADDTSIRVWDYQSKDELVSFSANRYGTNSIVFLDDNVLLSGGHDGIIHVYSMVNKQEVTGFDLNQGSPISQLQIDHSQGMLASAQDGAVILWNTSTLQSSAEFYPATIQPIWTTAFTPNGQEIVFGGPIGDIDTGDFSNGQVQGFGRHDAEITHLAFNSGGDLLASRGQNGVIQIWDYQTGNVIDVLKLGHVTDFALTPDSDMLAAAYSDGMVELWGVVAGEIIAQLDTEDTEVRRVMFDKTNNLIVTLSVQYVPNYQYNYHVKFWHTETLQNLHSLQIDKPDEVILMPDVMQLLAVTDEKIDIWDVENQTRVDTIVLDGIRVYSAAKHPFRDLIAIGGEKAIHVWDLASQSELYTLQGHEGNVRDLAFNATGTQLTSADAVIENGFLNREKSSVCIWNIETREQTDLLPGWYHTEFSANGSIIAFSGWSGETYLWDTLASQELRQINTLENSSVVFSNDGTLIATVSQNGTIAIWGIPQS